jgi:hypothetical protein
MISGDENWSLILHQGHDLARHGTVNRRIVEEMTSEVLVRLAPHESEIRQENSEVWFGKGETFYYGIGVSQNFGEAFECYKIAAKLGHKDALCNLACMAAAGLGISASIEKTFEIFSLLVYGFEDLGEKGFFRWWVASQLNMACYLSLGLGVKKDELGAFMLMNKAQKALCCASAAGVCSERSKSRVDGVFTFFDIVCPSSSSSFPKSDEWFGYLRKIRIMNSADKLLMNQILVIDGGDTGFVLGDLISRERFESRSELTEEEGGRRAYGLVFAQGSEASDHGESIVGQVFGNVIRIVSRVAWTEPPGLRCQLECLGLGPVVND